MTTTIDPKYIKNDWVQLSVTISFTDKKIRIYQNDKLLQEYVDADLLYNSTEGNLSVTIGKSRNDDSYFKGLIDNLSIYSTLLTTTEIESLYFDTNDNKLEIDNWSHI